MLHIVPNAKWVVCAKIKKYTFRVWWEWEPCEGLHRAPIIYVVYINGALVILYPRCQLCGVSFNFPFHGIENTCLYLGSSHLFVAATCVSLYKYFQLDWGWIIGFWKNNKRSIYMHWFSLHPKIYDDNIEI